MGYVGNAPAEKYTTIDKQTLTGNNTVGPYTLTHSVGNEQEIEVFVNNVRQEPGVSYTVSSNQLTMSASVASADDFYVIFQGKAKMTATHPPTFDLTAANGTFTGTVTTGGLTVGSDTAKTKFYSNSTYNGIYNGSALTNNESIYMGSGTLFFYSSGGERMRIDSSGNVGIAIAPQSFAKLQVKTSTDRNVAVFDNAAGTTIGGITDAGASTSLRIAGQNLIFTGNGGSGAEHMRIDSSGQLIVGHTGAGSPYFNEGIVLNPASDSVFHRDGNSVVDFSRETSDGNIVRFVKDNSVVGSIGTNSGYLYIGSPVGNDAYVWMGADAIAPSTSSGGNRDNAISLGTSANRFKDLHLSGGVVFGATGGNVTGKTLDDYEEGNWTPQFGGSSTTGTGTYSTTVGRYVKVGKKVNCWGIIVSSGTHNGTGTLQIHGLPFTKENTYLSWGTEANISYHFGLTSFGTVTNVIRLLGPVSNGTFIRFHSFQNNGDSSVPPTPANVQSGTSVYFAATYEVQ